MLQSWNDDETTPELLRQGSFMEHLLQANSLGTCEKSMVHCHQGVLLRGSLRNLKAHELGRTDVFTGFQIFQDSPADRESDRALAELLSGTHLQTSHPYLDGCCLC